MFHHTIIDSNFGPPTLQKTWPTNQFVSLFLLGAPFQSNPLFFLGVFWGVNFVGGDGRTHHGTDEGFVVFFFFLVKVPSASCFPSLSSSWPKAGGGFEHGSSRGLLSVPWNMTNPRVLKIQRKNRNAPLLLLLLMIMMIMNHLGIWSYGGGFNSLSTKRHWKISYCTTDLGMRFLEGPP